MNKSTLLLADLIASQLTTSTWAQTTTTPTTRTTVENPSASQTAPASDATTVVTKADSVKPIDDKRFFGTLLLDHASDNLVKTELEREAKADTAIDTLHFLQLGYKVTNDTKVSLRQYFTTAQSNNIEYNGEQVLSGQ